MTSANLAIFFAVTTLLTPKICAGLGRENSAIESAGDSLTLAVILLSLVQRDVKASSPAVWQDVAQIKQELAARMAFVGSLSFLGLLLVQVVLTMIICQGSPSDFGSMMVIIEAFVSAFIILIAAGLHAITSDALADTPGHGAPPDNVLRNHATTPANWLSAVPLPPPIHS